MLANVISNTRSRSLLLLLVLSEARPFAPDSFELPLTEVTNGLDQPVRVTHAGDGSGRGQDKARGG